MNFRKFIYFSYIRLRGSKIPWYYKQFLRQDQAGLSNGSTTVTLLEELLNHCREKVPYYRNVMKKIGGSFLPDPEQHLQEFPILTKDIIRQHFEELKAGDLSQRKWFIETSGGSTGEPIKLIQDQEFNSRSLATALLYSKWAGAELGQPEIRLWGSSREVAQGTLGLKATFFNFLTNTCYLNAFQMTPEKMFSYIKIFNQKRPKVIIAYAQAVYELARFAEQEQIPVIPQKAIITSAGTLYPFMRDKIENVFQCKVFNRYGSREVGAIACQCQAGNGLHVAPWGNYIEIVDDHGTVVPRGTAGNILVTSLGNYAMPLIRYQIGDRGILSPESTCACGRKGQLLQQILGRTYDAFRKKDGTIIDGAYFSQLVYSRGWVRKYQITQQTYSDIIFKIVPACRDFDSTELEDISYRTKRIMGENCNVKFELVDEIPPSPSGKFRYTVSEVQIQKEINPSRY